jgi:phosphatidate cytidylyltransferase
MPFRLSDNLVKRIVSALSLLPIVLGLIYLGGWWFYALLALGGALMILEWLSMMAVQSFIIRTIAIASVLAMPLPLYFVSLSSENIVSFVAGLIMIFSGVLIFISPDKLSTAKDNKLSIVMMIAGIAYVSLALVSMAWLRQLDSHGFLVIWLFFAVWAMDVGGYFAGKGIGGPKLAPTLSPKKTWAGLIGGMVLSALVSGLLAIAFSFGNPALFAGAGAMIAVIAQIGDLYESALKRKLNLKDSGTLIPGHGGILDRVDGLIFAAPFTAAVLAVMIYIPKAG